MEVANKANLAKTSLTSNQTDAKSSITHINYPQIQKNSQSIKISYTIQESDHKRLNKQGNLRLYNYKDAIEIPVTTLLGKWKGTHIGITIFKLNEEWQIEGGGPAFELPDRKPFVVRLKKLMLTTKTLSILKKLKNRIGVKKDLELQECKYMNTSKSAIG